MRLWDLTSGPTRSAARRSTNNNCSTSVSSCPDLLGWTAPRHRVPRFRGRMTATREPSAMELKRIAIDTSKSVFTLHGVDAQERPVLRRDLRRGQLVAFFAKLAPTEVVLEACGGSHHWARTLSKLGHRVGLIPPQYVKPF